MAELIVEIVDRNGVAVRTQGFDALPVRIGRGYGNDLIVADPYVGAEHVRIGRDEAGFVVEDLGTQNGVYMRGRRVSSDRVHVESGEAIVIGGTRLRLLSPSHPVPPALSMGFWSRPGGRALSRVLTWASLLPTFGVLLLDEYLSSVSKARPAKLLDEVISVMILALVWAAFWSLVGYTARRHTRFHAQLLIANAIILSVTLLDTVCENVAYGLNLESVRTIGMYAGAGLLFGVLVFRSMGLALETGRRGRVVVSTISAVVVVLIAVIVHFAEKPDFEDTPVISTVLKPPYVKVVPGSSVDAFLQRSRETFARSREQNGPRPAKDR